MRMTDASAPPAIPAATPAAASSVDHADLAKDAATVASMFDKIASRYDLINDLASLGQDRYWRRATVTALDPQPGQRILDLAAGTGTSSQAIYLAGGDVVPCDISTGMIAVGKQRYPHLPFVEGDATDLPFDDGTFDAVTMSFGLRNVEHTEAGLREMLRVTKPGGRLVVCEFSTPSNAALRKVYMTYLMGGLPRLAGLVSKDAGSYQYLADSIRQWPNQQALGRVIRDVGWTGVQFRNLTGGIVALHRAYKQAQTADAG